MPNIPADAAMFSIGRFANTATALTNIRADRANAISDIIALNLTVTSETDLAAEDNALIRTATATTDAAICIISNLARALTDHTSIRNDIANIIIAPMLLGLTLTSCIDLDTLTRAYINTRTPVIL